MEYINESLMQLTVYHLALFPLAPTLSDEELIGWSMIGFVGAIFLFNLGVILVITIFTLKRKLYIRGLKKKQDLAMKDMQEKLSQRELLAK